MEVVLRIVLLLEKNGQSVKKENQFVISAGRMACAVQKQKKRD